MNLSKIHHIAIIVSDYEAAKDFYVNKLGFSVIRENYRPERKDWKLDLRVNEHTELEIFAEENPPKRVNRPEACGLRHLAFCVESVEQTVKAANIQRNCGSTAEGRAKAWRGVLCCWHLGISKR